jgi:glutathione reductase (NADPH)
VAEVRKESERIGIKVHTGVKVKRVEKAGKRLRTVFEVDGREHSVKSDRVVNGAGRIANVEALDLDAGKIVHDGFRIAVDDYLRSKTNPSVYVCGDVTASPQLSPVATYEGRLVGQNIVEGAKHKPDYASLPSCVYTVPAFASVGLSEATAKEKGLKIRVQVNDMEYWFATRTFAETVAWSKIIVEEGTDKIVGAHFVGHAGEGAGQPLRACHEAPDHGEPDPRLRVRLSDLLRRHQAHALGDSSWSPLVLPQQAGAPKRLLPPHAPQARRPLPRCRA